MMDSKQMIDESWHLYGKCRAFCSHVYCLFSPLCSKLASFMQTDEETFRTYLLLYKHKTRNLVWKSGPPLSGEYETGADVDFYLNGVWLTTRMCCLLGGLEDILCAASMHMLRRFRV